MTNYDHKSQEKKQQSNAEAVSENADKAKIVDPNWAQEIANNGMQSNSAAQLKTLANKGAVTGSLPAQMAYLSQLNPAPFKLMESNKSEFLSNLQSQVSDVADEVLAETRMGAANCPYIVYWFEYYADKDPEHISASIGKFIGGGLPNDETSLIDSIAARVRDGLIDNMEHGSLEAVPEEIPKNLEDENASFEDDPVAQRVVQFCWPSSSGGGSTGNSRPRFNHSRVNAARRAYEASPSLRLARAWHAAIRASSRNYPHFSTSDQQAVTAAYEAANRAIRERQRIEQAGDRTRRAITTISGLETMRSNGVEEGSVDYDIINDYTNPSTGRAESFFNNPLREEDMTESQATAVTSLQQSLLRCPVERQQRLWRGTRHFIGGVRRPQVGHSYREPGFFSTSRRRSIAEGFGSFLIEITSHSSGRDIISLGGDEYGGGEDEVLFPAGTSFIYLGELDGVHQYREGTSSSSSDTSTSSEDSTTTEDGDSSDENGQGALPLLGAIPAPAVNLAPLVAHHYNGIVWANGGGTFSAEFLRFRDHLAASMATLRAGGLSVAASNVLQAAITAAINAAGPAAQAPHPPANLQETIFDNVHPVYGRTLWALLRFFRAHNL